MLAPNYRDAEKSSGRKYEKKLENQKQLEKGFIDKIIDRRELRDFVSKILKILN